MREDSISTLAQPCQCGQDIQPPTQPMSYNLVSTVARLFVFQFLYLRKHSFKNIGNVAYVYPKYNHDMVDRHISESADGSESQHFIIGACALSARTYNAEVHGSDARLRNHFENYNTSCISCSVVSTRKSGSLVQPDSTIWRHRLSPSLLGASV